MVVRDHCEDQRDEHGKRDDHSDEELQTPPTPARPDPQRRSPGFPTDCDVRTRADPDQQQDRNERHEVGA
jgi:hypothetical protein